MEYVTVKLVLLLVVAVVATVFTFRLAWKNDGVSRKHVVISSALCLLGLLGLIPGVREKVGTIRLPDGDSAGYWLVLTVAVSGVLLGMVLAGRTALAVFARDFAARLRLAAAEFRDPALRERNDCVRRYQRAVDMLAKPVSGSPERLSRNRLFAAVTLRGLSDKDVSVLASYLNFFLFEGEGPADRLADFLRAEREMVAADLRAASGHLVRLTRLAQQIHRGMDAK
jgi:hypothetical protein